MFNENELIELNDGEYQFLSDKFEIMSPEDVNKLPCYIVYSRKQNFIRLVNTAIDNELDDKESAYIKQKYFDDLSITEMSEINNVSRQSIYRIIERASKKLFTSLKYAYMCGFTLLNPPENFEQLILNINKEEIYENHCC